MSTTEKPLKTYTIEVIRCNPSWLVALGEPAAWRETITIEGRTLADAKRRADIR
jgi:hypothetical protein